MTIQLWRFCLLCADVDLVKCATAGLVGTVLIVLAVAGVGC